MIETPTALVLGAGASHHLSYPLGIGLLKEVCGHIKQNPSDHYSRMLSRPESYIQVFFKRLSRSGYYSVDEFLEDNRDLLEVGKLLMAGTLKAHEDPERVFAEPGWYQYLFNCLLGPSVDDIPNNKLSIITFNYDRSLEFYLHQAITHRYRISEGKASQLLSQLNIIHPHGTLGHYPAIPYSTHVDEGILHSISSTINVVHEIVDSKEKFCTPEFRSCHDALGAAENIYFLGFGFHEANVRRMAFFNEGTIKERKVLATHLFGTQAMNRKLAAMKKYGFSRQNFEYATCQNFFKDLVSLE